MFRNKRSRLRYGALEPRCLLANSTFFLNTTTDTLHVTAVANESQAASFANELTFSVDVSSQELVVDEVDGDQQRFDLAEVRRISYRGTAFNDRFNNQTDIPSRVVGFAGDDEITSGDGDDTVIAANGDDTIYPGDGDDFVAGGQGNDQILEAADSIGADRFFGGPGSDTIEGGGGADYLAGHEDNDTIRGGAGGDIILGHAGTDSLFGGEDRDFLYGGDGDDILAGELGLDRILGQDGNDTIDGGEDDDSILGGNGNDTIDGGDGDDHIAGNFGNDTLRGGTGADRIIAGAAVSNGNPFGFDTVDAGNDSDVDFIVAHPVDQLTTAVGDRVVDTEVVRLNLQTRFLANNIINPSWQQTASGLQYRIVTAGTGQTPTSSDSVRVNYSGTFIDGEEFDANDNISFGLNQVIAGWTEGLQLVQEGGTIELAIPANLAYGDFGRSTIPGGSTLLFRVDLLEILA